MLSNSLKVVLLLIVVLSLSITVNAGNDITSSNLLIRPTFEHIALHLNISGDDNRNSTLEIEYKLTSASTYLPGAPTMRAHPTMLVDGVGLNRNFHAGSAMFLQPGQAYNIRLTLTDPDGGGTVINRTVSTKAIPMPAANGQVRYVIPGTSGGTGTANNPFQGLQTAMDAAVPGDIFEVGAGVYTPFTITTDGTASQPITIRSTTPRNAIIDGNNTTAGVVTVGNFSDSTAHIIIDGFVIRNGRYGVDAQNTQYLTVRNNDIYDVDWGIPNRRENGWEHNQYFTNNRVIGRTAFAISGTPNERGIDVRGDCNVVSYNTIANFADGVSTDGAPYGVIYALDIHNNDIRQQVDDLIEVDGVVSNTRIYQNSCYNGRAGISLAPVFGGPAYVFRNELYNMNNSAFKMNRSPAGLIIVNNTAVKAVNGMSSPAGWQNTYLRNNAILGTRYVFEEYGLVPGSVDDWDYNGHKSTRGGTGLNDEWFKWDNVRYTDLAALQAGTTIETNGIEIDLPDFVNVTIPTVYGSVINPSTIDINPSTGSSLINAGANVPNMHLPYVTDGSPDIGAIEAGQPAPEYGHDFGESIDVSLSLWLEGTYDIASGSMTTGLLQRGLLPAGHPYNQSPWNYTGIEGAGWTISDYPINSVDWVLVSFRTAINPTTEVAKTAGVLLDDGTVFFPNQEALSSNAGSEFYIVVEHRNHLIAMTDAPVSVVSGIITYDFRQANSYQVGGAGQSELTSGIWGLFAGDSDKVSDITGYDINGNDNVKWTTDNGLFNIYSASDFSLDGDVSGFDRLFWSKNNGIFSAVPK